MSIVGVTEYQGLGHETITVGSTPVGLTTMLQNYATCQLRAFITCEGGAIRFWMDGSNPTSTKGHLLEPGQNLTLEGYNRLIQFKAIRAGTSDGILQVSYERA